MTSCYDAQFKSKLEPRLDVPIPVYSEEDADLKLALQLSLKEVKEDKTVPAAGGEFIIQTFANSGVRESRGVEYWSCCLTLSIVKGIMRAGKNGGKTESTIFAEFMQEYCSKKGIKPVLNTWRNVKIADVHVDDFGKVAGGKSIAEIFDELCRKYGVCAEILSLKQVGETTCFKEEDEDRTLRSVDLISSIGYFGAGASKGVARFYICSFGNHYELLWDEFSDSKELIKRVKRVGKAGNIAANYRYLLNGGF